jgi:hypothetical protein
VAPAVITELPDGTLVAAVPQSHKGMDRGRSFWGSGGGGGSGSGGHAWTEALAGLRAHWPAARPDEEARGAGAPSVAPQPA